jgi:hypothetical protein
MTVEVPDTVNWNPLLTRLSARQCGAFMYIGHVGPVHLYKHILTRRYLNLDSEGNCYVWNGRGGEAKDYVRAEFREQLVLVTEARE